MLYHIELFEYTLPLAEEGLALPLYTIYLTVEIGMAKSWDSEHENLLPIKMTKSYNRRR